MSMIRLAAIKKSYESAAGEVTALKGVDLEIERGEIYGIIGLSGAGKSTLIRCINMLERPTEGKVIVDGKDLTALSEAELREERKGIGMIFQHFNLLSSATVYDNVAFPLRLSGTDEAQIRTKVEPLLAALGRAEAARRHRAGARVRSEGALVGRGDECARPADDEVDLASHRRHQQEARPDRRHHHA